MKFTVILLLLAVCHGAEVEKSGSLAQKNDDSRTEKRALEEGNAGVKRATVIPGVLGATLAPGIEYADSQEVPADKSPAQEIYSTPVPQIAKISDVLTGQGPYQAAIASHLYSPVSIYQARLASPTTYEVSAPVPSRLAYSEKITYQPQGPVQYTPQIQYNKLQTHKQPTFPQLVVPQELQSLQSLSPALHNTLYQQQQLPRPYQHPLIYNQPSQYQIPQVYQAQQAPRPVLVRQFPIYPQLPQPSAPGIIYFQQENNRVQQKPIQRELKEQPEVTQLVKQPAPSNPSQNNKPQYQGAVSYASFSQSLPTPPPPTSNQQPLPTSQPQQNEKIQKQQYQIERLPAPPKLQYQPQPLQYQPQQQFVPQPPLQHQVVPLQYQLQPQLQIPAPQYQVESPQYQVQPPQYQVQIPQNQLRAVRYQFQIPQQRPQPQYQANPIQYVKYQPAPANNIPVESKAQDRAPQVFQPQNQNYQVPSLPATVTFPPVQYFGKFAQNIFANYQQQ